MMRFLTVLLLVAGCGGVSTNENDDPDAATGSADGAPTTDAPMGPDGSGIIPSTVFVTSSVHMANLGGRAGADSICAARANDGNVPGTFVAWLALGTDGAHVRLPTNRSWQRVDGTLVASSRAQLISGSLAAAISLDETGVPVDQGAWTGTQADGTSDASGDCIGWTTSGAGIALTGATGASDGTWTAEVGAGCGRIHHLYCFEI